MLPKNIKNQIENKKMDKIPDLFIYGASYVGKSSFVDELNDVLFINTDGNYELYKNPYVFINKKVEMNGRLKIETSAWENFLNVVSELEKGEHTFKYIALDLVEDLREYCRVFVCKKLNIPHESDSAYSKAWDMVTTEFNQAIKRLKSTGCTLILISKEVARDINERGGASYTTFSPNLPEKASNILAGMVKLSTRCYIDDNGERKLNLKPNPHWFGGGRFNFKVTNCPLNVNELLKEINETFKEEK